MMYSAKASAKLSDLHCGDWRLFVTMVITAMTLFPFGVWKVISPSVKSNKLQPTYPCCYCLSVCVVYPAVKSKV